MTQAAGFLTRAAFGYAGPWTGPAAGDSLQIELLEEALTALGDEDSIERALVLARLATSREDERPKTWDEQQIEALHQQAIAVARRAGDASTLAYVLCAAHSGGNWHPDVGERLRRATEALRLAERAGDRETMARAQRFRHTDLLELGDVPASERAFDQYRRLAEELRQPSYTAVIPVYEARRALMEGRFQDAERRARWAANASRAGARRLARLCLLAQVCALLEDGHRAGRLYDLLLPFGRHNAIFIGGTVFFGSVCRYLGLLARTLRRPRDAARHFEDALAMNERMGARPWLAFTQCDYAGLLLASSPGPLSRLPGKGVAPSSLSLAGEGRGEGEGVGSVAAIAHHCRGAWHGGAGRPRPPADRRIQQGHEHASCLFAL